MQVMKQRVAEIVALLEAHEAGDAAKLAGVGRERLGLLVVDHLQAMLELAEKLVGFGQLIGDPVIDPPRLGEGSQRVDGALAAQIGIGSAIDQLMGLGEELDFPNPAATELDVVTENADLAAAAMGIDPLL